jgi:hypothetical protein
MIPQLSGGFGGLDGLLSSLLGGGGMNVGGLGDSSSGLSSVLSQMGQSESMQLASQIDGVGDLQSRVGNSAGNQLQPFEGLDLGSLGGLGGAGSSLTSTAEKLNGMVDVSGKVLLPFSTGSIIGELDSIIPEPLRDLVDGVAGGLADVVSSIAGALGADEVKKVVNAVKKAIRAINRLGSMLKSASGAFRNLFDASQGRAGDEGHTIPSDFRSKLNRLRGSG